MTLLVTGFDPFGGMTSNPSQTAGAWLAAHREDTVFVAVPTAYAGSITALDQAVRSHTPNALLLLGFAAGAIGLRLERCAGNRTTAAAPDNDGKWRVGPIETEGPDRRETLLDYDELLHILDSNGIPRTASDDAGGYVCNWLYWHALAGYPRMPILFVHLAESSTRATWRQTSAGLLLIADGLSDAAGVSTRRAASLP